VTQWSDPTIVATNGGTGATLGKALAALGTNNEARNTIKVIYRGASSGTTYAFTDFLHQAGSAPSRQWQCDGGYGAAWGATNVWPQRTTPRWLKTSTTRWCHWLR